MSDYEDLESLWEQRNQEDKLKGINREKVTPEEITVLTEADEKILALLKSKKYLKLLISQMLHHKLAGLDISDEKRDSLVSLAVHENISFDDLDAFVEEHLTDLLKQQDLEQEENFSPLKLENVKVDTKALDQKIQENQKTTDPFKVAKTPIPQIKTNKPENEEINKNNGPERE